MRSMRSRVLLLALSAVIAIAALTWALVASATPPSLQEQVRAVASTLRCPVCQDLSVADSPSAIAREMRSSIAKDLLAGRSPDEIRSSFVRAYGDWILLEPPTGGLDLLAWVLPAVCILVALGAAGAIVSRWTRSGRRVWEQTP